MYQSQSPSTSGPSFARKQYNGCPEGSDHPDELLSAIPFNRDSITQFVNHHQAAGPGNVNPALVPLLTHPAGGSEPDWLGLLRYYAPPASQGLKNLQDLYLWVTRVGLPNAVIDNRRLLLSFYFDHEDAPMQCRLRYDTFPFPNDASYLPPFGEQQHKLSYNVENRAIFRYPLPNGQAFRRWLQTPINVGPFQELRPNQMEHQQNLMDWFFNENETAVRRIGGAALVIRTVKMLKLYRWVSLANEKLEQYKGKSWENKNWEGIESEMTEGSGWTPKRKGDWPTGLEGSLEHQ